MSGAVFKNKRFLTTQKVVRFPELTSERDTPMHGLFVHPTGIHMNHDVRVSVLLHYLATCTRGSLF